MAVIHFTTIPCEPNTHKRLIKKAIILEKFVPVLTTLSMLGLKLLELMYVFMSVLRDFVL